MRWALCGLAFALAVGLAIGTAAIRAQNVRDRREMEQVYRELELRAVELRRLGVLGVDAMAPDQLAARLHAIARAEQQRRAAAQAPEVRQPRPPRTPQEESSWQ